jgi:hypothetical protein
VHLQLRPVSFLERRDALGGVPSIRTAGPQSSEGRLRGETYLVVSFNGLPPTSSGAFGQYAAKIS